jgi:hypothetical protein
MGRNYKLRIVEVITGKDVIHNIKQLEKQKKEFENSMEDELRNGKVK